MIKPSITETIHIGPQPGPQTAFLESKADFTLFGGSVGCSKTYGVVLDTLKHIDVPGFKAVLFRRTLANAKKPGGLWDTTCAVYRHLKANPLEYKLTWKFPQTPSGAEVRILNFGHDSCKADYQGMQATAVYWDELTEFEEDWVFYMFSRMRGMTGIKTYMKATCNPDQSSWVRKLVDWYVDDEGFPIPERSGVLRYFSRRNDSYQWGNNKEEVLKQNESYMSGINDLKRVYLNNRENMLLKADRKPEEKTN